MVEGFFAQLTNKAIRRGTFASVPDLIAEKDGQPNLGAQRTDPGGQMSYAGTVAMLSVALLPGRRRLELVDGTLA
jgi:hypothetical protein